MMVHSKWVDAVSIVVTSLLIGLGMEALNVSGQTNYATMFGQVFLLSVSLLIALFIFTRTNKPLGFLRLIITILVGLTIWFVCHTVYLIYSDWWYISSHPDDAVNRHLLMIKVRTPLVPIFGIVYLAVMLTTRTLANVYASISKPDAS